LIVTKVAWRTARSNSGIASSRMTVPGRNRVISVGLPADATLEADRVQFDVLRRLGTEAAPG